MKYFLGIMAGIGLSACSTFAAADNQARLESFLAGVEKGSVIIIGESHAYGPHRGDQLAILQGLRDRGHSVSVGMEFLEYPDQEAVTEYKAGKITEEDLLKRIKWGGFPFAHYRDQINFPQAAKGEQTIALNAPRGLTSRIAKVGVAGLTPEEFKLMPPDFHLGNELYRERFVEVIHELPADSVERYFAAQSTWDETMAWKASMLINPASQNETVAKSNPDAATNSTLVIIVGEFHVQYGGGLPDRIRARAPQAKVHTISLLNVNDYEAGELERQIQPHPKYGVRADLILAD